MSETMFEDLMEAMHKPSALSARKMIALLDPIHELASDAECDDTLEMKDHIGSVCHEAADRGSQGEPFAALDELCRLWLETREKGVSLMGRAFILGGLGLAVSASFAATIREQAEGCVAEGKSKGWTDEA